MTDALGRPFDLAALIADRPAVATFNRGGWRPYANLELRAWRKASSELDAAGAALVAGEIASARQVAEAAAQAWGRPFLLETLGDRAALDAEIARRQAAAPPDPMAWVALQYHRGMLATLVSDADNARYPGVRPAGLAAFLAREAASAA